MNVKSLEQDETILVRHIEDPDNYVWISYVDGKPKEFQNWHSAYETLMDQVKFWLGYYGSELDKARDMGLTWTADEYDRRQKDYDRWVDYLMANENSPQEIHLVGGSRKLAITTKKKEQDG